MKNKKFFLSITAVLALSVTVFAFADNSANSIDPYQNLNKETFKFNTALDQALFQPLAQNYAYVVPGHVRTSISHFFKNFVQPAVIINDILQGDYLNTMADSWRFFINSTLGVFGFCDVASDMNVAIPYRANDFGLTLRYWGLNDPKYFVIPFFGPSTDVDVFGRVVNYYAFSPYIYIHPWALRAGLLTLYYVNERAQLLQYKNLLAVAELDPYVFQRNAYLQQRDSQIAQIKQDIHNEYSSAQDAEPGYFLKPSH